MNLDRLKWSTHQAPTLRAKTIRLHTRSHRIFGRCTGPPHPGAHLAQMDHLRQGIGLRGYAQKNPKQEYKREAFEMFTDVLNGVRHETISILSKVQIQAEAEVEQLDVQRRAQEHQSREYLHPDAAAERPPAEVIAPVHSAGALAEAGPRPDPAVGEAGQPFVRTQPKVGRNAPCPCGSGKKYKHCHGKL